MSSAGEVIKPDFKDVKLSTDQQPDRGDICFAPKSRAFDKTDLGSPWVECPEKILFSQKCYSHSHPIITELPRERVYKISVVTSSHCHVLSRLERTSCHRAWFEALTLSICWQREDDCPSSPRKGDGSSHSTD